LLWEVAVFGFVAGRRWVPPSDAGYEPNDPVVAGLGARFQHRSRGMHENAPRRCTRVPLRFPYFEQNKGEKQESFIIFFRYQRAFSTVRSFLQSISKDTPIGLNEDTLGGVIKSGIAQFVALELSRGNGRDNRAVSKYLPWLCNTPSSLQQGYAEFFFSNQ